MTLKVINRSEGPKMQKIKEKRRKESIDRGDVQERKRTSIYDKNV